MTLTNRGGARWADAKRRAAAIRAERARENGMYLERDDFTQDEWDFLVGLKREAVYHGTRTGVEAIGCAHLRNHQLGWSEWPGDFIDAAESLDGRGIIDWSPVGRNRLGGTVAFRLPACSVTFESVPASAPDPHDADGVPLEPPSELMAEVFGERAPDEADADAAVVHRTITHAVYALPYLREEEYIVELRREGDEWAVLMDSGRIVDVKVDWSTGEDEEPSARVVQSWWRLDEANDPFSQGVPSDDEQVDDVAVARIRPQDVVSVESDGLTGTYSGEQVIALLVADKVEREESAEQAYSRVQLWGYSYSVASQSLAAVGCTDLDQLHALAASIRDGVTR